MNATGGSYRLHFSRLRRGKTPLEEQEGCAAKNEVCRKQHILLFAKMQIRFAHKGHLFVPNFSGYKTTLDRQFFECRAYLKNRHKYPAYVSRFKVIVNK